MEKKRVNLSSAIILCSVLLEILAVVNGQVPEGIDPVTPAMFVFGDSLIDNGNNNFLITAAKANYFPYGIDFGGPTGRFSNGLTAVDYGARYLGLPLIPSYCSTLTGKNILRGINYASAAAGILDETGRHYGQHTTLTGQINEFEITAKTKLPLLFQNQDELAQYLAKAVFLIDIGGNDYLNNYLDNRYDSSRVYSPEAYADLLRDTLSAHLTRLYNLGARKMALVGSGPLGCIPKYLSTSNNNICREDINKMISMYNSRLIDLTTTLKASLPGSSLMYHNTYDRFHDMINNPSKYGFTETTKACCGNGKNGGELTCLPLQQPCANRDQYIFWDSFHPTQAANAIISYNSYSQYGADCIPFNIYHLAQL